MVEVLNIKTFFRKNLSNYKCIISERNLIQNILVGDGFL
jgi:hypothetical protein